VDASRYFGDIAADDRNIGWAFTGRQTSEEQMAGEVVGWAIEQNVVSGLRYIRANRAERRR